MNPSKHCERCNSWEYTRLGDITDQDTAEMEELLGNGDVTITVSMEDNK